MSKRANVRPVKWKRVGTAIMIVPRKCGAVVGPAAGNTWRWAVRSDSCGFAGGKASSRRKALKAATIALRACQRA